MRIFVGSDEATHLTDAVLDDLRQRGHDVTLVGPPAGEPASWVGVARSVAEAVASGAADEGLLCCWTGTGVSLAANKVPGVRAALCLDAETARGARLWNRANVVCCRCAQPPKPWPWKSSTPGSLPPTSRTRTMMHVWRSFRRSRSATAGQRRTPTTGQARVRIVTCRDIPHTPTQNTPRRSHRWEPRPIACARCWARSST